jgi:hypothetical protein
VHLKLACKAEMSKSLGLRIRANLDGNVEKTRSSRGNKRLSDIKRKVTKSQKRVSNPLLTRLGHHGVTPEAPNHFITDLPIET